LRTFVLNILHHQTVQFVAQPIQLFRKQTYIIPHGSPQNGVTFSLSNYICFRKHKNIHMV